MKLREITIGYTVPSRFLGNNKYIKNALISLVGGNLLYFAERTDFALDQYTAGIISLSFTIICTMMEKISMIELQRQQPTEF